MYNNQYVTNRRHQQGGYTYVQNTGWVPSNGCACNTNIQSRANCTLNGLRSNEQETAQKQNINQEASKSVSKDDEMVPILETKRDAHEHTVEPEDTLYKIAMEYGTTVEELKLINNLQNDLIFPGQTILLPVKDEMTGQMKLMEYITVENDTFSIIEEKSGVPLELIAQYNDLTEISLQAGQSVAIPYYESYIIKEDDTIEAILERFGLSPLEFIELNPQYVEPGATIHIGVKR